MRSARPVGRAHPWCFIGCVGGSFRYCSPFLCSRYEFPSPCGFAAQERRARRAPWWTLNNAWPRVAPFPCGGVQILGGKRARSYEPLLPATHCLTALKWLILSSVPRNVGRFPFGRLPMLRAKPIPSFESQSLATCFRAARKPTRTEKHLRDRWNARRFNRTIDTTLLLYRGGVVGRWLQPTPILQPPSHHPLTI